MGESIMNFIDHPLDDSDEEPQFNNENKHA